MTVKSVNVLRDYADYLFVATPLLEVRVQKVTGGKILARVPQLGRLKALTLSGAGINSAIARDLLTATTFDQIPVLDLSHNPIGDPVHRELVAKFGDRLRIGPPHHVGQ